MERASEGEKTKTTTITLGGGSFLDRRYGSKLDRRKHNRDIDYQDGIETETRIQSSGPMALDEFSSQVLSNQKNGFTCVFGDSPNRTRYDEIASSGLWTFGSYVTSRSLDSGLTKSGTRVNGTGMVSLKKMSETQNLTHRERAFAAGDMNISEYVEYGGAEWVSRI